VNKHRSGTKNNGEELQNLQKESAAGADWSLRQCGNCHKAFFLRVRGILKIFSSNLRLFLRFRFFLKTFSEKVRLFSISVRVFQGLRGFLNTFLVELRLF
jgi:hypothetical protein